MEDFFTMSRESLKLEDRRVDFEGKEDYEVLRQRLRSKVEGRAGKRESDRFMRFMQQHGGGNLALAWRRHFDSEGVGELNFREFLEALILLKYHGDVPALWRELGSGDHHTLSLQAIDPENAAILDYFGNFCMERCGGPLELFKEIDNSGSDAVNAERFLEGLQELGLFDNEDLPTGLAHQNGVLLNLFPLLDKHGHGCISGSELLFLITDSAKKEQVVRQMSHRTHVAEAAPEPLYNEAQRLLHKLHMHTTMLGGSTLAAAGCSKGFNRSKECSRTSSKLNPKASGR